MTPFGNGFSDELTKLGDVTDFLRRLRESPELRQAILKSTAVGAATGAVEGLALPGARGRRGTGGAERMKNRVRGALSESAGGALAGLVTGAIFPGWFHHSGHFAEDELERMEHARSGERAQRRLRRMKAGVRQRGI